MIRKMCTHKNGCGGQKCQYLPKQVSTLFACFSRQEVKVSMMLAWYALLHINELSYNINDRITKQHCLLALHLQGIMCYQFLQTSHASLFVA